MAIGPGYGGLGFRSSRRLQRDERVSNGEQVYRVGSGQPRDASAGEFWCAAFDYRIVDEDDSVIEIGTGDHAEEVQRGRWRRRWCSSRFPTTRWEEPGSHRPEPDRPTPREVERLIELGARRRHRAGDVRWTVMADPEGNEFCASQPHAGVELQSPPGTSASLVPSLDDLHPHAPRERLARSGFGIDVQHPRRARPANVANDRCSRAAAIRLDASPAPDLAHPATLAREVAASNRRARRRPGQQPERRVQVGRLV